MYIFSITICEAWDQGSSSVVPSLPGFQQHFKISSGSNANEIRHFISLVYIGYAVGAALSFVMNDRIGRLWSFRLYVAIWVVGQLVAIFAPGLASLYVARIVTGTGIGALTVTGPMSLVEISPAETRGLITSCFVVAMAAALVASTFCVYSSFIHISATRLQYQVVWFSVGLYHDLSNYSRHTLTDAHRTPAMCTNDCVRLR